MDKNQPEGRKPEMTSIFFWSFMIEKDKKYIRVPNA
jgi:hypothetical protein